MDDKIAELRQPAAPGHALDRVRKRQEYRALSERMTRLKAEITATNDTRQRR